MNRYSIYIFDIDNTLIDTTARIRVTDSSGRVLYYHGSKVYGRDLSHTVSYYDYTEFHSLAKLLQEPKRPAWNRLAELHAAGADIYIITAREGRGLIKDWLNLNGIHLLPDHIYTNELTGQPICDWKADKVREIIRKHPAEALNIHIWEDEEDNIKAMKAVENEYRRVQCRMMAV